MRIPAGYFNTIIFTLVLGLQAKEYKGAEYRTLDTFLYGRFEVRYKAPAGNGLVASFFTYHEIESLADWNEIDFEILGRYDHDVQMTTIGPTRATHNSHQWIPFDPSEGYHDYAFEWTPDYIAWFTDGIEVYRQTGDHIADFYRSQKIMMNIWPSNAENWTGVWDESVLPVFAFYDYVRYAAYTPGTGTTGTDNNFTPQWSDEFDDWDQSRWQKATHTFEGNECDFVPENAVFKDGNLILCLTTSDQTGYVDLRPPRAIDTHAQAGHLTVYFSEPLDQISAENPGSYFISGIVVHSAELLPDKRSVALEVQELDPEKTYTVAILGVRDDSSNKNKQNGQVLSFKVSPPLEFPVMINAGPGAVSGFLPDQIWKLSGEYGYQDGYEESWPDITDIEGTDLDSVFSSARHEVVGYKVRVPDGKYVVTFLLAENNEFVMQNPRLFNIEVENIPVADSINIYEKVGLNQALEITTPEIAVYDGVLDIHFTNLTNYSLLNGLIVEQTATSLGEVDGQPPAGFDLSQNYPNPFNGSTTIQYALPAAGHVVLSLYDIRGRQISVLEEGQKKAGLHRLRWDAPLASGVYFYHLNFKADGKNYGAARKMLLIR